VNAPFAADPARSRGRLYGGGTGGIRGPRDAFQRDRDRIIHSVPFRRLRHKTQVFVAPDGDHFRVRLTHSLEVAQIGRTMARALHLNEDLVEALCLAHDIGHPPFGHSGEDALSAAMTPAGGFDHNAHTLRVLTTLEAQYPHHPGLDLSWETLEGLAKHNGPVAAPNWALRAVDAQFPLDLGSWPSLEAQVAAIADDIAYDNHDIDDGLRAGLFTLDQLLAVPLIADQWQQVVKRHPSVAADRLIGELVRDQIGMMVNDVLDESRRRIRDSGVASIEDVHAAGGPLIAFSASMTEGERSIKSFLYEHMYRAPGVRDVAERAKSLLAHLFDAYRSAPELLPTEWQEEWPDEVAKLRTIGDFVAGMTDRYAIAQYRHHIGEVTLPEAF
jgi:dGTPase